MIANSAEDNEIMQWLKEMISKEWQRLLKDYSFFTQENFNDTIFF